jgi:hypothetical protein
MIRSKMFIMVEALLRCQASVSRKSLWKNCTHPGGDRGGQEEYDCLDLHGDGVEVSVSVYLMGFRVVDEEN